MISKDIIKKVKQIQIATGRLVTETFAGQYESVFKGRGIEFSEVREYAPGDDIRSIDWNVTARMQKPYIKLFTEERELTVILLADISASCAFGSADSTKSDMIAELAAVLAFSAIRNNDKVGLIMFSEKIENFIPPKKGTKHVLRVIRDLLYFKGEGKKTDIAAALEYLGRVINKKAVVFLISDFIGKDFSKPLKIINKKHDIVSIMITDPRESELTDCGLVQLRDAERGETVLIDTSDENMRGQYNAMRTAQKEELKKVLQSNNMDFIELSTGSSYIKPLVAFFRKRALRFR